MGAQPSDGRKGDVTLALERLKAGESGAFDALLELVYPELRALAHQFMKKERRDHTLGATAVVHEACLKLLGGAEQKWSDRKHFRAVAGRAMRQILTDHARKKRSQKPGGAQDDRLDGAAAVKNFE